MAIHQPYPSAPAKALGEVIWQYTDTLCTMPCSIGQTSQTHYCKIYMFLMNTILPCGKIGSLTMRWQQTSSVKAEQGLLRQNQGEWHTLVTETITSNKSWDEIKDLLWLKLCNATIHTYTSQFMEIQQWEKESLVEYIHWFKTEAKRCNFTNDGATIRIFIKGLKNAHSLATCIYEKGPQMLTDAISIVENLNAVQQLTTPSTVNTEDHCFQCQEQGCIARNHPNIRCLEMWWVWSHCNGSSTQDTSFGNPSKAPPTQTTQKPPCQVKLQTSPWGQGQVKSFQVTITFYRHHSSSYHDSYRGCSRSWHRDNCHHHRSSSQCSTLHTGVIAIKPTMTHHINLTADHLHTDTHNHNIPETEVAHIHVHLTNPQDKVHIGHTYTPADHEENHITRRTPEWK